MIRSKKKKKVIFLYFFVSLVFIASGVLGIIFIGRDSKDVVLGFIDYKDDVVSVRLDNAGDGSFCAILPSGANTDDVSWVSVKNGICRYRVVDVGNYIVYLKDSQNNISKYDNLNKILKIVPKKYDYYLALNASFNILYDKVQLGDSNDIQFLSNDSNIVSFDGNNFIANGLGKTSIDIVYENKKESVSVLVTDLINVMPTEYNYDRSFLPCNRFSSEEAQLLDEILFSRVNDAGYQTRAGVVAVARFLTLEFPYRIKYFSENGRLTNYSGSKIVDGEGRYYHKGLYLSYDKVKDIKYVGNGPNPWGCTIYSDPSEGNRANGLDCSGFTTWVVYNGGFDIEDLGAYSGSKNYKNLNDIGEERILTLDLELQNVIKAGDLLGEVTISEGHSAIIVGIDDNYYYVAESLWYAPLGVNINKYKRNELYKYFETVNLMDSYYGSDGNYTAMWY